MLPVAEIGMPRFQTVKKSRYNFERVEDRQEISPEHVGKTVIVLKKWRRFFLPRTPNGQS
jgi:hypothetical protein